MKKAKQELEQIDQLFQETKELLDKGLIDASLMYCRKIVEGITIVFLKNENIAFEGNLNDINLREIEIVINNKYDIPESGDFFKYLKVLRDLGNIAAHFSVGESGFQISENSLKEALEFVEIWFNKFITQYYQRTKTKDLYFDPNNNALPFCIKYVEIENYQTLQKVEISDIPVDSQFIVLTGKNGEGKTSILQAIAIGIYGDYDKQSNFVLSDKKNTSITIEALNKKKILFNKYKGFQNPFSSIEPNNNLVAYGASRLQLQSSESQDQRNARQSNVYGIFKTDNVLQNIEYWFKMQIISEQTERLEAVKQLLIELMPSIEDIKIGRNKLVSDRVRSKIYSEFPIIYIENGVELSLEQLSAGNKSIVAMVGDMVIRLYNSQPKTINPSKLYGIVLIDELETHLHPKWQKRFPELLNKHFPLIQFIISTHSPIVFLGMPANTVFYNISRDKKKKTVIQQLNIDIKNMMPHQILTSSLFGMDNIRNIYNEGIEELNVETQHEIDQRLKKEEKLKSISKDFKFKLPKA